jgi:hypothetical protein
MISAEKCRIHATACKELASSVDIPTQRSLEQSIMALNWEALADQIDRENSHATAAAFSVSNLKSLRPGGSVGVLLFGVLLYWPILTLGGLV